MSDGTGSVTISIDDNKNKTYDPTDVTPDANNNIVMSIQSMGSKTWTYKPTPITISADTDFSWSVDSTGTILTVSDDEADRAQVPQHSYTVHVQSSSGDSLDFDPIIKDRT